MKLSSIDIKKGPWDKTLALVSVTFDNCFVVKGLKIVDGSKGVFVAFPQVKTKNPEKPYQDSAHPITKDFRDYMINEIMAKFSETVSQSNASQLYNESQAPQAPEDPDNSLPF